LVANASTIADADRPGRSDTNGGDCPDGRPPEYPAVVRRAWATCAEPVSSRATPGYPCIVQLMAPVSVKTSNALW